MYIRNEDWVNLVKNITYAAEKHKQNDLSDEILSGILRWMDEIANPPKGTDEIEFVNDSLTCHGVPCMTFNCRGLRLQVWPCEITGVNVVSVDGESFNPNQYTKVMQDCVNMYLKEQQRRAEAVATNRQAILARLS